MLDEALQNAVLDIPSCIAIGAVDLTSGTLLALQSEQERPQEMLNILTATITEMFEAPLLQAFAEIYAPSTDESAARANQFTELLLLNNHHNYLLLRGRKRPELAIIVITKKDTPAGLLMMKALAAMPDIENAL
jgi:hypothetical protein